MYNNKTKQHQLPLQPSLFILHASSKPHVARNVGAANGALVVNLLQTLVANTAVPTRKRDYIFLVCHADGAIGALRILHAKDALQA